MVSTIGSYVIAVGMLVFVANVIKTARTRQARRRTIRGRPTRSSGTQPHLRPHGTSTASHRSRARARCATCGERLAAGAATVIGPWARLLAVAAVFGTGLAVVSGAADWGTAHELLAALALPPIAGLVVLAWISARRLLPAALAALVLFGLAALLTAAGRPPRRRLARLRRVGAALRADVARTARRPAATSTTTSR